MRPPAQVPAALVTCKPLSDPVRLLANILLVAMFLGIVALVIDFLRTEDKSTVIPVVLIISALFISAPALGMWLLLSAANRTPAIYLRAFRTDRPAHRLRSLLKAALGSRYRICGIRPPHERSSWLVRIFGSNFLALRYIGSERFELEAEDHNWMARLLASYVKPPWFSLTFAI